MKNISEINPSQFGCFYYTPNKGEVSVYLFAPNENIEYTEYEAFECENGTVIAFNRFKDTPMDYAYLLNCGNTEEIIQYQTYEYVKPFLDGAYDSDDHVFVIMSSRPVADPIGHRVVPIEDRCDRDVYGAVSFRELTDGVSDSYMNHSIFTPTNMSSLTPVLTIQGSATIWRIGLRTNDNSHKNYPVVTAITETLVGLLRMCCEWRAMTQEPFNNTEYPALKIAEFMDEIGINAEIENDIRNAHNSMPVEKFITDPLNARNCPEIITPTPASLTNLLKKQMRYMTLFSLSQNTDFSIDNEILIKEASDVQGAVYSFFVQHGVDPEALSSVNSARSELISLRLKPDTGTYAGIDNHLSKLEFLWNQ